MSRMQQNNQLIQTSSSFYPEEGVDIKKIIHQLYRQIWFIVFTALGGLIIALLYTFTIQPQYQSTALIRIKSTPSTSSMLLPMAAKSNADAMVNAQIALMRTRYILEPVVVQNHLNIHVAPNYFPIFGAWIARRHQNEGIAKPFLGLSSYAWGGESLQIKKFSVPKIYVDHSFKLVVGSQNTYQVFSDQDHLIATGKVGESAFAPHYPDFILELSDLKARPGTEFFLSYKAPIPVAKDLGRHLKITNVLGNDSQQNTGIEQAQLIDSDPNRVVQTLNTIINYTVTKNIQQKTQEIQSTLRFLSRRLPELKSNLEKSETKINLFHQKSGILSMTLTGQLLAQRLTVLIQTIEKLKSQKEELLQEYTPEHPLIAGIENKEKIYQQQLENVKSQIKQFPNHNQIETDLAREAKIKNTMYVSLLGNEQQLQVTKAGLLPDAIILTDATPAEKVPSYKLLIILLGFILGAFISTIIIIIRNAFSKTVENSEHLEDAIQIRVQSVVPFSRKQKQLEKISKKGLISLGNTHRPSLVLAKQEPEDMAIESLRSLRISLQMTASSTDHRVIALMGSLSNIGKSFVSLNLAQVISDTGKRTLLIDADVRRGRLHHTLHQPKTPGLSEYLENKYDYQSLIRPIHDNLYFIPCGTYLTHPMQLFQSPRLQELIESTKNDFDQIIIDTPPIIPVIDSVLIAKHCGIKLFVVSAGKDKISDVKQAVKKSRAHGIEINGLVLNHRKPLQPYGARDDERYSYATI